LRPTPDRVRETLFNWLGQRLDGWLVWICSPAAVRWASRRRRAGAQRVVMLERDRRAADALRAQCPRPAGRPAVCEVQQMDALAYLDAGGGECEHFDLILLDPPFERDLLSPGICNARRHDWRPAVKSTPNPARAGRPPVLTVLRQGRAGLVAFLPAGAGDYETRHRLSGNLRSR
jgi:16S rRNA (guanine966-N2)-methyltransferase